MLEDAEVPWVVRTPKDTKFCYDACIFLSLYKANTPVAFDISEQINHSPLNQNERSLVDIACLDKRFVNNNIVA